MDRKPIWNSLVLEVTGSVAYLCLNRPQKSNALDSSLFDEIPKVDCFYDATGHDAGASFGWATYLRMVVNRQCLTSSVSQQPECQQCLTHCGSTGIDLGVASDITKTITQASCPSRAREQLRLQILSMQQAFTACESCRVPIIASVQVWCNTPSVVNVTDLLITLRKRHSLKANYYFAPSLQQQHWSPIYLSVQGHCVGAGIDLATACDIRCCTAGAQFCVKEIDLGITADLGTLQRLFRLVGEGRSRELALTAQVFSGDEALQWGLVTHTFPTASALAVGVDTLAETIAAKSPVAAFGTKQVCLHSRDHTVAEGLEHVALWNSGQLVSSDILEIFAAVKERRSPRFASKL